MSQTLNSLRGLRHVHTGPPIKTYGALNSRLKLWWSKVPATARYGSVVVGLALSVVHLHPNTLVTLGPPVAVGVWFAYLKFRQWQFQKAYDKIKPVSEDDWLRPHLRVKVKPYDESDLANVAKGIDNEYDNLRVQVFEHVERRILDHVSEVHDAVHPKFVHDDQFVMNLGDVETFVTIKVVVLDEVVSFVKMSVPYFADREKTHRQGVVEVYLLEDPSTEEYRMVVEVDGHRVEAPSNCT